MMRVLMIMLCLVAVPVWAVQPDEILKDPALEQRARDISKKLRCLVCRNENIDSSNAGVARDLRLLVRERLLAGDSNEEAVEFVVDRYGEYVLLKPRFSLGNAVLWFAGPAFLLIGALLSMLYIRGRARAATPVVTLSKSEQGRLAELMKQAPKG